ncbi:hypothetical protein [Streptomyces sp. MS1.AVA.4]|uniref:Uncharacterized protein n=1 Tax=Streptomyces pratisoli TaxID=3139917 RepID=A0ACC6Q9Q1_9ACTN
MLYDWMHIEWTAGNTTGVRKAVARVQQVTRAYDISMEPLTEQTIDLMLSGPARHRPRRRGLTHRSWVPDRIGDVRSGTQLSERTPHPTAEGVARFTGAAARETEQLIDKLLNGSGTAVRRVLWPAGVDTTRIIARVGRAHSEPSGSGRPTSQRRGRCVRRG